MDVEVLEEDLLGSLRLSPLLVIRNLEFLEGLLDSLKVTNVFIEVLHLLLRVVCLVLASVLDDV